MSVDNYHKLDKGDKPDKKNDFIAVPKRLVHIILGLIVQCANFCLLKKKIIIYGFGGIFILLLVLYLIFFDYIEPSVQKYKNVNPDVFAWNQDKDIFTIEYEFIYDKNRSLPQRLRVDSRGIIFRPRPRDLRKYVVKEDVDTFYIPTDMSGAIIILYNKYQTSPDQSYLDQIKKYAYWLKDHATIRDSIAIWTYPFGFTKYDMNPGWTGAWAMGDILSALARYYQISKDSVFLQLGQQAVKTFHTKIEDGGILAIDENSNYWFEEYPTIPKNSVLNGHINGIFGLYDFWRVTRDSLAANLIERGINTVKYNIEKYDSDYWSYYDLKYSYVTNFYYHKIVHLSQLSILYQISGEQIFNDYYNKWKSYLNQPYYFIFKFKILIDALHRRLTYKSIFTLG